VYFDRVPFSDHVVLELDQRQNRVELPYLGQHVLPFAIGVSFDQKRFHTGAKARVALRQQSRLPIWKKGRCYEIETVTTGGFTLQFNFEKHGRHGKP